MPPVSFCQKIRKGITMKRLRLFFLLGFMALSMWGCGQAGNNESDSLIEENNDVKEEEDTSVPLPDPENGKLTADEDLIFTKYIFRQLGFVEFTEQDGEIHKDKASDGMTYLVLFLEFENNSLQERYLDVSGFNATVDGKEIDTTFLINDPQNYPVFSQTVQPDMTGCGYVVWEVPEDWKKLEYTYEGLAFSDNITFTGILTKNDLSEPDVYEQE